MIRILCVDDEPPALERLRNLLGKQEGCQVIGEYTDPWQALTEAGHLRPDIVMTDICMDGISGLEMLEQMRRIWGKTLIFVIISGYGEFHYAKKAMELGVRDYLLKPVTEKELSDVLGKVRVEIKEKRCAGEAKQQRKEAGRKRPVSYMKRFIQDYYMKDITLQMFADEFSMNKAYLGQKFRKETGISVNDYVQERRIEAAARLADTTEMTWKEIAEAVGYKNYVSFYEYFVRWKGVFPADYRRQPRC